MRVVLVIGARQQIDQLLEKQGEAPQYAAGYRITDSAAMQTAVQAAGASRMAVEAQLSKVLTTKFCILARLHHCAVGMRQLAAACN